MLGNREKSAGKFLKAQKVILEDRKSRHMKIAWLKRRMGNVFSRSFQRGNPLHTYKKLLHFNHR